MWLIGILDSESTLRFNFIFPHRFTTRNMETLYSNIYKIVYLRAKAKTEVIKGNRLQGVSLPHFGFSNFTN